MRPRLPGVLAELGRRLPSAQLAEWAEILRASPRPSPDVELNLARVSPAAGLSAQAAALCRAWSAEEPTLHGRALALALTTAAAQYEECRPDRVAQVVVSGPVSAAVPVRLTASVVTEVIRSARETVLVVSFAAYGVREVIEELRRAMRRGVRVEILLEESTAAARVFDPLKGQAHVVQWGTDRDASGTGARGALHAKLIVADRHTALVGSANLTDRALGQNIEVGVILRDRQTVGRIVDHFHELTSRRG
ncbi:DISARM system phospholipase D-like protein DrmC [Streptomyces apocyni]|uniref:DISARM system phospholipase D-like protein DrmC n=1 Tax=Streptomyces apocyni TaxID=2654677 RepID=UPI0012EAA524|nr:DISARM system phospholipase D-like protein DrmC [Streptomyces apocyni]